MSPQVWGYFVLPGVLNRWDWSLSRRVDPVLARCEAEIAAMRVALVSFERRLQDEGVMPHAGSAEEPAVYFKPDVGDEVKFGERADSLVKTIERGTRPRAAAAAARPGRRAAPGRCCE